MSYIQSLSGKLTLSGQHNFPASGEKNTLFAADYIGKTPVVWSQDFGFSQEGDKDSYLSRPAIIQEAIRQHKKVQVLWRPYHEMNGDWFWWGGRYQGKYTSEIWNIYITPP